MMLKIIYILTLAKTLKIKILNFKLVIMLEYQKTKKNFAKGYTAIWPDKVFVIKKVKKHSGMDICFNDLNGE